MAIFSPIGLNTHHKRELSIFGLGHKNACSMLRKKILTKIEVALCHKLMTLLTLFTLLTWFTLLTLLTLRTVFILLLKH